MQLFSSITKEEIKDKLIENVKTMSRKTITTATSSQIYEALAFTIRDVVSDKWIATHEKYEEKDPKTVYYLSMEFLMGRFLGNTIINLTLENNIREVLNELNIDINDVEDAERDPGLGNGGLGRLAACFLDSLSTLEYPAYGCGIRYHYGIFEQSIVDGYQVEKPDNWLEFGDFWGVKRQEYSQEIHFGGSVHSVKGENGKFRFVQEDTYIIEAIPFDYPIIGFDTNTVNSLRLWDAQAKNRFDLGSFNKGDYNKAVEEQNLAKTLSEVLYPADDMIQGKELRLKQQYFFISASIQLILKKFVEKHDDFKLLPEKVALQLNDTHPSMAVAELMRLLVDVYGLDWNDAWNITVKTCAYTNHTIMSEALEKWPTELFSRLLPRIYMIIEEINRRFCQELIEKFGNAANKIRKMAIIADGQIRMAYLAIVGSHSVNGVAALHSEILQKIELKDFYEIYPDRFNNKTNGITQRRWLAHCNPKLSNLITEKIGDKWVKDLSELRKLAPLAEDKAFRDEFMQIKKENKEYLAKYILSTTGIVVDPNSIFDIQVKRLHEYKRQLLNALHILALYNQIKERPWEEVAPRTFIFGAKAAAGYRRAKLIIKLINSIGELVNNDPEVNGKIKVVFMENYRVSLAEKLVPACDVSEQISTAGKEASGTGNMKFMLNGAVTVGTLDGANVEIFEEVGNDNIFIFGMKAYEIEELYASNKYDPWDEYNLNQDVRKVLMQLIDGTLEEDREMFREIYDALLNGYAGNRADEYFILRDFASYQEAQKQIGNAFSNKERWAKMAILNTAFSGKFSSDRTIEQYAKEIWGLEKVKIEM